MPTDPKITMAELTAGIAAARDYLATSAPLLEQHLITKDTLQGLVAAVVTAVNDVRAEPPKT